MRWGWVGKLELTAPALKFALPKLDFEQLRSFQFPNPTPTKGNKMLAIGIFVSESSGDLFSNSENLQTLINLPLFQLQQLRGDKKSMPTSLIKEIAEAMMKKWRTDWPAEILIIENDRVIQFWREEIWEFMP